MNDSEHRFRNVMRFLVVGGVLLLSACTGTGEVTSALPATQPAATSTASPTTTATAEVQRIPYLTIFAPSEVEPMEMPERGIYLVEPDGDNLQRLTEAGRSYRYPQFSHDGAQIAYVVEDDDGSESLAVYRLDTQEAEILFEAGGEIVDFAWAPDSSRIALSVKTGENTAYLTLFDFESGVLDDQLEWEGALDSLSWSFDSNYLAFAGSEPVPEFATPRYEGPVTEVYLFNPAAGQLRQLTVTDGLSFIPAWSPAEYALAYEEKRAGLDSIQLVYPFAADIIPREIATLSFTRELVWSPDGKQIAYGGPTGASVVNVYDGTTKWLMYGVASYYPIDWSPDGRLVLVEVMCCAGRLAYIVDTEKIDEENPTEAWSQHPVQLNEAQWSPVEDLIVFTNLWVPTEP